MGVNREACACGGCIKSDRLERVGGGNILCNSFTLLVAWGGGDVNIVCDACT